MKVGDKLVCHTEIFSKSSVVKLLTLNKIYEIVAIHDDCIIIINDYEQNHWFDINLEDDNYKKWFHTERKIKLEKIKEISNNIF